MAKGGGGEGHYDERRRALKPTTGFPDDPAVLQAISKPRAKPTVVVKKKKVIPIPKERPGRGVQTDSNSGEPLETGTEMKTTRYNVGRLKPQNTGFASPAREPRIRPQNTGFANLPDFPAPARSAKSSRLGNEFPSLGNYSPGSGLYGQGLKLLDWAKRRTTMKNLDT